MGATSTPGRGSEVLKPADTPSLCERACDRALLGSEGAKSSGQLEGIVTSRMEQFRPPEGRQPRTGAARMLQEVAGGRVEGSQGFRVSGQV